MRWSEIASFTLSVKSTWRKLPVGRSVATGLLKISSDFLSKRKQNTDKKPSSNLKYLQN